MFKLSKFFLHSTVFTVVLVSVSTLFPFIVGKYTFFRLMVELALGCFVLGLMIDPEAGKYWARLKQLFRHPLVWAISAFVFFFVLAGTVGVRPSMSFWSNFERGEGGFQMLHLYVYVMLLATLFREVKDWRRFFTLTLVAALMMCGYGFLAGVKYFDVVRNAQGSITDGGPLFRSFQNFIGPGFGEQGYRFQGSIGNPAYVAAYLIFAMFNAAMLAFFMERKKRNKILVGLTVLIFAVVFYFTGTRGALLGLIGGLGVGMVYLAVAYKAWRKWILPVGGILAAIVISLIAFQNTDFVKGLPGSRIFAISLKEQLGVGDQGTFSTRTVMWSIAWDAWKDRPVLGYGPENFIWVFDRYFDPRYYNPAEGFGAWFDRAHSIFFDQLVSSGILGLLSFLSIFGVLAWMLVRKPLRHMGGEADWRSYLSKSLMLALPTAYLIQGIVLFDVLTIYMGIFSFFAFALFMTLHDPEVKRFEPGGKIYIGSIAILGAIFFSMIYGTFLPYAKAARYIAAERTVSSVKTEQQFEDHYNKVLEFPSPVGGEEIPKFLSSDVLGVVSRIQKDRPTAVALVEYMEKYLIKDDIRHILMEGQLRATLWQQYELAEDFDKAEAAFKRGHEIAPNLPQPMIGLITLYKAAGDKDNLEKIQKEYLSLWPNATSTVR